MRRGLFQYVSDLHLNKSSIVPKIQSVAPYLGICGNIGRYDCNKTIDFLKFVGSSYDKVFFVPGNRDYNCTLFNKKQYTKYISHIEEMCDKHNIHLLNNSFYEEDDFVILGSTLWYDLLLQDYKPSKKENQEFYSDNIDDHLHKYKEDCKWLKNQINKFSEKNVTIMTHYPPTQKLISKKYYRSMYCNNLDNMFKKPIKNWLFGHIHTTDQLYLHKNNIFVGINSVGINAKKIISKSVSLL